MIKLFTRRSGYKNLKRFSSSLVTILMLLQMMAPAGVFLATPAHAASPVGSTTPETDIVAPCDSTLNATGSVSTSSATLIIPTGACPLTITFASYSHTGLVHPLTDQILVDHITSTYGPGTYKLGPLNLSCNWQTDLYSGEVQPHLLPGSFGLIAGTSLYSYDFVENQNCDHTTPPAPPTNDNTFKVKILKYVDGVQATASSSNNYAFPFTATFTSPTPVTTLLVQVVSVDLQHIKHGLQI